MIVALAFLSGNDATREKGNVVGEYTIERLDGMWLAYCHHCNLVQRRSSDFVGLTFAAIAHAERRHNA